MRSNLARVEAIIYVAGDHGVSAAAIASATGIEQPNVERLVHQLAIRLATDADSALQVTSFDQRYQLTTKPEFLEDLKPLFKKESQAGLSQAGLEVLTIIAYNQPVTRVEVDDIRGVNSAASIQKMLKQGLVKTVGKKAVVGTPVLYAVSDLFLNLFGLHDLAELPPLDLDTKKEN